MYNQITIGHVKLPKSALNKGRYLKCVMQLLKVPKSVLGCPIKSYSVLESPELSKGLLELPKISLRILKHVNPIGSNVYFEILTPRAPPFLPIAQPNLQ